MTPWREGLRSLKRYPSAALGVLIIAALVATAIYAVVSIPYSEAQKLWRGGDMWQDLPVNAGPVWADRLFGGDAPRTIKAESADAAVAEEAYEGVRIEQQRLEFDFPYSEFPSEVNLFLESDHEQRQPFVRTAWITPEGDEIPIEARRVGASERISISQNQALENRLGHAPQIGLFTSAAPDAEQPQVRGGEYTLLVETVHFEEQAKLDAELVVYGQVHGWAGTDHQRRDLSIALLWGTPIALAFGLLAAVGTTVTTLLIAATGVWYRGWVDATIQRLTEINIILPLLPVLVMIGTLYSTSIWLMLGVVVVLGIFSAGIKMYRAMLLPIREAPYIEAARSYGASNMRIIMRYMVPRILPVLIPTFVTLIPTYVFLEASLAVLGLGDPVLPTWGKVLYDAQDQSALYHGFYYWVLSPAALLMLTGLGFAMLGFALDRVFNPRLRNL
ncbi:ABC transporter permease [Halorhodospira halochloris]|uniref:Oligopeptide transport system permease protein OppC n=1 Tax=Halorhodospira halochloris TaxID=1052 RepID=A0A110B4V6_HALHR|nr:ABC transporter permease [Halorhodospira halochloris]MBK1650724.1 ABC transporter permease [Halorhodospira halochloris]MCG5530928.1 ABC transporter permease [Halorhodospira halochloris]MCG5549147.1 ABC transporter permease [Halorhodospira halochloris]BAU56783.1 oligopeptide transport system permease protein OppC [Halorhodospira halochloris]